MAKYKIWWQFSSTQGVSEEYGELWEFAVPVEQVKAMFVNQYTAAHPALKPIVTRIERLD